MEPMLITHVMPELKSETPFLRSRACWVYGEFGDYEFQQEDHVKNAVDGIYQALFAPELPVRLSAALAMSKLIKNETAEGFLKPALANILEVYLKIMNDIDSEELIGALEEIMTIFKDDMGPFALQISTQLVEQYKRLIQTDVEEDDGEAALAALGCVTAIVRVLHSIEKNPPLIRQVEAIIFPILMHSLTPDGLDAIEDGIDIINTIVYHGTTAEMPISADLWKLFPQLLHITVGNDNDEEGGYGFEYLSTVATTIQNYVTKGTNVLMTVGPDQTDTYYVLTCKAVQRIFVINSAGASKQDGLAACRIFLSLIETFHGNIDLQPIICILLAEIQKAFNDETPKNYKAMLLQTISMCFWNNPQQTLQTLEQNN